MASFVRFCAFLCLCVPLTACTRLIAVAHDVPSHPSGDAEPLVVVPPAPAPLLPPAPPVPSGPALYLASGIALFLDDPAPPAAPAPSRVRAGSPAAAAVSVVPAPAAPAPAPSAPPASGACGVPAPAGYAGPAVAGAVPITALVVARGLSWWVLGRRHALTYADLARLNGLSEPVVRAGRGLRAGRQVYVVARTGAHRLPPLAFCGDALPSHSPTWRLYPERERWRSALDGTLPSDPAALSVPALADPHAVWVRAPGARTFERWAARARIPLDALLRYNGVEPVAGLGSKRPAGALALPPS